MITIVTGGQYGSEGKGAVSSWLTDTFNFDLIIRTGGPNAGHTFIDGEGITRKMRQLPCGWSHFKSPIYIPAGAVINKEVFLNEVNMLRNNGYNSSIVVSPRAAIIEPDGESIESTILTGTTGEGIGATRASKCLRKAKLAGNDKDLVYFTDKECELFIHNIIRDKNSSILIEASQGFGLSLNYGEYPYVTSTDLTPYQILNDAEIPFEAHKISVNMVIRPYPIRIAGNSGTLYKEISWDILRERHGQHIPVEQTTVTKKTRRVGEWDNLLVLQAIDILNPNVIFLNFVDYIFPAILKTGITKEVIQYVSNIENLIGRRIDYLGVSPNKIISFRGNF